MYQQWGCGGDNSGKCQPVLKKENCLLESDQYNLPRLICSSFSTLLIPHLRKSSESSSKHLRMQCLKCLTVSVLIRHMSSTLLQHQVGCEHAVSVLSSSSHVQTAQSFIFEPGILWLCCFVYTLHLSCGSCSVLLRSLFVYENSSIRMYYYSHSPSIISNTYTCYLYELLTSACK